MAPPQADPHQRRNLAGGTSGGSDCPTFPGPGVLSRTTPNGLRPEDDVDEIAKLCADLAAAGFIEPTTWH